MARQKQASALILLFLKYLIVTTHSAIPPKSHELTSDYTFAQYVTDFSKPYTPGTDEYKIRESLFQSALDDILSHNNNAGGDDKQAPSFKKGVNQFTDMREDEVKMGFDKGGHWLYKKNGGTQLANERRVLEEESLPFTIDDVSTLPKEVDWRTEGITTPVKDQGGCGSCWAFATTALMESYVAIETGLLFTLSPQQLVSCVPNPHHCGGNGGCGGSTFEIALDYIKDNGMTEEDRMGYASYEGKTEKCPSYVTNVAGATGYKDLPVNSYEALMNAVAKLGPVGVSVAASGWAHYEKGVFSDKDVSGSAKYDLNHAVVLEGYGTDEETGEDYWLVRNSWSPKWGEKGYIRLKREEDASCGNDVTPADGSACTIDDNGQSIDVLPAVKVCGTSGILVGGVIPLGVHRV